MIAKLQEERLDWFRARGYEYTLSRMPLGRGALLLNMRGKWIDSFDLTVNVDGSYHLAWEEEMAA